MEKNITNSIPSTYIQTLESTIFEQQEEIKALNEKLDRMNLLLQRVLSGQFSDVRIYNTDAEQSTSNAAHPGPCEIASKNPPSPEKHTKIRTYGSRTVMKLSKLFQAIAAGLEMCGKKAKSFSRSILESIRITGNKAVKKLFKIYQTCVSGLITSVKTVLNFSKSALVKTRTYGKRAVRKLHKLLQYAVCCLKLCRKNVKFSWQLSLEKHISIRTQGKGLISFRGYAVIRSNCELHADGGEILIGDLCFLNRNCMIVSQSKIEIGAHTSIGPNVVIYDHDHDYIEGSGTVCSDVRIGKNVWIGANATILRGSVIGDNCVIGAGALVKGKIDDNTMVYSINELKQIDLPIKQIV